MTPVGPALLTWPKRTLTTTSSPVPIVLVPFYNKKACKLCLHQHIVPQVIIGISLESRNLIVPSIGSSEVYFSGGYITQRHGNQGIDGIQVEIPRDLRIDGGEEGRTRVGHALGKAISDFYHFHYLQLNKVK